METSENNNSQKKSFSEQIKNAFKIRHFIGLTIGGIAGFLYYYYVGCQSGFCALKSNPYYNILLGLILGYLIADMVKFRKR